ncbi:TetR/AcrR family transcriptional regulator [Cohnella silvisoli]|uniref:TetR/AcrR family transcriptional regulator n=1 Tax=Cohnella silvisoli TaxID=2873699 RepID=A0ABV1KTY7_9BACL|nr:TetR/AcrR family transcriptional regulator [Cohnella silvisoli]MCD9021524.1 TetR/AcrR family transcriptional regulator [Cohnella silvisoli]
MDKITPKAASRKEDIISAAITVFADLGYYRATTAQVAAQANISQPYVYRFYNTKEALLLAALERSWDRILQAFSSVREKVKPEDMETAFTEAYKNVLRNFQSEILLQMQAQTIQDPEIRKAMQSGMKRIRDYVLSSFQQSGYPEPEERTTIFLAKGMLCNIALAIDMDELMPNHL